MSRKNSWFLSSLAVGILCAGLLAQKAAADDWNERTVVDIDQPVQVPGAVLQPGTYVFKLYSSNAERKVVQVYNRDETHLIVSFIGVPIYRENAKHTILEFDESPGKNPRALLEWFYAGDNYGLKFNY